MALAPVAVGAAPAAAAPTLPLGAEVRVVSASDVDAFQRSVATRYHTEFRKVVAADIDRDGDVDVVAATDRDLVVWVNDGAGRLTSRPPAHGPVGDFRSSEVAWRDRETPLNPPIPTSAPVVPLPRAFAHAPPAGRTLDLRRGDVSPALDVAGGCRSPRAPPA